jgi:hypothetical protein
MTSADLTQVLLQPQLQGLHRGYPGHVCHRGGQEVRGHQQRGVPHSEAEGYVLMNTRV